MWQVQLAFTKRIREFALHINRHLSERSFEFATLVNHRVIYQRNAVNPLGYQSTGNVFIERMISHNQIRLRQPVDTIQWISLYAQKSVFVIEALENGKVWCDQTSLDVTTPIPVADKDVEHDERSGPIRVLRCRIRELGR